MGKRKLDELTSEDILPGIGLTVFFSGPMRDKPDFNYPVFNSVEQAWLEQYPVDVTLNPAKNFRGRTDLPFAVYMQKSLEQVLQSQIVVLLPSWEQSEGAAEYEVPAARVTSKIFYSARPKGDGWVFDRVDSPAGAILRHVKDPVFVTGGIVRTFDSGATRDTEDGKLDFEAFLSPLVLRRYAEYMHTHRQRSDGSLRAGDDWQKGMPKDVYMKSMWRHFMEAWNDHRGFGTGAPDMEDSLCGVIFNAMGYLYETQIDHGFVRPA